MAERDAKARLYEAALELMGRNGISATSTREILAAAGIKNPSAISYHFGSKAGLIEELAVELTGGHYPILGVQTALASGPTKPTAEEWVQPVIDTAIESGVDRAGLPAGAPVVGIRRLPEAAVAGAFLTGDSSVATAWRDAVARSFPQLPKAIGVARNVTVLRTVGWMVSRVGDDQPRRGSIRRAHPRALPALVGGDRSDAAHRADEPDRRGHGGAAPALTVGVSP